MYKYPSISEQYQRLKGKKKFYYVSEEQQSWLEKHVAAYKDILVIADYVKAVIKGGRRNENV